MSAETEVRQAFGQRLRELREAATLTQEQLGFEAGLDRSYVGQVERGERNVSLSTIAKLAGALTVSPAELMRGCPPINRGTPCT